MQRQNVQNVIALNKEMLALSYYKQPHIKLTSCSVTTSAAC